MSFGDKRDKSGRPFPWAERRPKPENVVYINEPDRQREERNRHNGATEEQRSEYGHRTGFVPRPGSSHNSETEREKQQTGGPAQGNRTGFVPRPGSSHKSNAGQAEIPSHTYGNRTEFIPNPSKGKPVNHSTDRTYDEHARDRQTDVKEVRRNVRRTVPAFPVFGLSQHRHGGTFMGLNQRTRTDETRTTGDNNNDKERSATILAFLIVLIILGVLYTFG